MATESEAVTLWTLYHENPPREMYLNLTLKEWGTPTPIKMPGVYVYRC